MISPLRQDGFLGFRRLASSLTFKVFVASGFTVLVLSGVFWYRSLQNEKKHLLQSTVEYAASFSELVRKGIREGMLHFEQNVIRRNIASIASAGAVRGVRVYDPRGRIVYSSHAQEVGQRAGAHEVPCVGCHHDAEHPHETLFEDRRYTIFEVGDGTRVLSYVEPIYNEPECATAACHVHPAEAKVLGIMLTDFSLEPLDRRAALQVREFSLFVLLYIVALGTVGYFVIWRLVLRPVGLLSRGMDRVAHGDLSLPVPVLAEDEIGRLATSFNAMTGELSAAREKEARMTHGLEEEIEHKTHEVRQTEGRLAEAEKLAALGRLTAEIAHEIRNPLTALGGYGRRLQRMVSSPEEKRSVDIIVGEVSRLERILEDVLDFSRPARFEFRRQALTVVLRQSLAAFEARCAEHGIRIETAFETDLPVLIDPAHLRRAVDNLVLNAVDVMPLGGTLSLSTRLEEAHCLRFLVARIADTGPGIEEENIPRIFEPFYTNKKMKRGTGLGLSITRKIIEAHGSFIRVANRPEGGLAVDLWFPVQTEADLQRVPCWEAKQCGRVGEDGEEPCPAYPHFGRACWAVAGTLCQGKVQGEFAKKIGDCRRCDFFKEASAAEPGAS